jgi:hypothetical protein
LITRKAIVQACEVLLGDKTLYSVTVFCPASPRKMERVRLCRKSKSRNEYLMTVGKPNFREREYVKRETKAGRVPKLMTKRIPKKRKAK